MTTKYAVDLNLPFDPWCNKEYYENLPRPDKGVKQTWHRSDLPVDESNLEFKSWLEKRGITYHIFDIFIQPPQWVFKIHADNIYVSDNAVKLNFSYGSSEGYNRMCWYKTDSENSRVITNRGGSARYWNEEDCEEVYNHFIARPSLVNTGQPHSVKNLTDEPRICFSFPLVKLGGVQYENEEWFDPRQHIQDHEFLQWDDAIEILKDYVVPTS